MLHMVENILDIQKFKTKNVKLKLQNTSLNKIIHQALEEVGMIVSLFSFKKIRLVNQLEEARPQSFDPELVQRVLVNLLTNAIKYSPIDSDVTIHLNFPDNGSDTFSKVSVRNIGHGIPPDMKEEIFEEYVQVDAKKTGIARSTGLGLTFCKFVIEAHNGKIWVDSEPDKGADFQFTLPFSPASKD